MLANDVAFAVLEVIGTLAFAISGGAVAVRSGMDWLGVVVLRDVLAQRRPLILVGQIYALAALAGAAAVAVLDEISAPAQLTRWLGVAIVVVIRIVAIRRQWSLPRFDAAAP